MKKTKEPSISDSRGSMFEFADLEGKYKQINILTSKKGSTRGKHYHKRLKEKFFVVSGLVRVTIVNVITQEKVIFSCENEEEFEVLPGHEHTLFFLEETIILSFYSEVFDAEDPDIFTLT